MCTGQGTYVILLADILPTFIIKLFAPYFMNFLPYWFRVCVIVVTSALSFVFVALSVNEPLVIFGVALASVGSGFGEITYLSLTSRYDKSTVSGWSSGTGAAGVGASLVYAGLKTFLRADVTLYIQVVVPVIMFLTYLLILGKPGSIVPEEVEGQSSGGGGKEIVNEEDNDKHNEQATLLSEDPPPPYPSPRRRCPGLNKAERKYWWEHVKYIPHLWKYMLPLFAVYAAEYMINQGFFELLYNQNTYIGTFCLDQATQYRWLQVVYQVGVLISRSSVSIYHFKHFWILAILQVLNFVFFYVATWYLFIPYFWITMIVVLYEGLLGGGVYVNAFYSISIEVPKVHREFSMGVASVADSTGITVAGVAAVFIHSSVCSHIGYQ
ncbi:battenin-like isoform X3 [Halichondria panicea]